MLYQVVGPHSVNGAATGEMVDLSGMTRAQRNVLVEAGHVALPGHVSPAADVVAAAHPEEADPQPEDSGDDASPVEDATDGRLPENKE